MVRGSSSHTSNRTGSPSFSTKNLTEPEFLSDFIHKLCHEVDNPLTAVISMASVLERLSGLDDEKLKNEKLRQYSSNISSEAWRVNRMMERLNCLTSTRQSNQSTNLLPLVHRTIAKLRDDEKFCDVNIDFDIPEKAISINISEHQLSIFLKEIFENSFHFKNDNAVKLSISENKDSVSICLENNFDFEQTEELEDLFKPFVSSTESAKTPGLGLSVAWAIIEKVGGKISLKETISEDSKTFKLLAELPLGEEIQGIQNKAKRSNPIGNSKSTASVLIIEDEAVVGTALQKMLELGIKSFDTIYCYVVGGDEAIKLFESGELFDVVLCDLNLQGISGRFIYEKLQGENSSQVDKFIFITGDSHNHETQLYLESTGKPFIHKPFEPQQLLDTVDKIIKGE